MKRLLAPAIIAAAALTLAACGSGDNTSTTAAVTSGSTPSSAVASSAATVKVVEVDGFGSALADSQGRVLYTSDEESADPTVVCTGPCEAFWKPAAAASAQPSAGPDDTDVGVAQRPDGTTQVTYEGHRLYTFTQDPPGQATGDGFSDTFGGQRFTWHVVVVDQTTTGGSGTSNNTPAPPPSTSTAATGYPGY